MSMIHLLTSIFFGLLASFCWVIESSYLRKYEKSDDSFEKYESYRKSLNYNLLKTFWYFISLAFLISYIIVKIL